MSRPACLALGLALAAMGCMSSSYNLATGHEDFSMTSTTREVDLGRRLARQVETQLTLAADEALQARVRSIGQRIVAVCDRQELVYSFAVIDEDEDVNAFSLPGGYVYVYSGLIKRVADDDELAAVIAHEVAHIVARHAVNRAEARLGAQLAQLAALATRQGAAAQGVGVALQSARLAYARQDELEADRLAVRYLKAAGFNPAKILTFLATLQRLPDHKDPYMPRGVVRPQYASTHPYVPERLRAVKEALYDVADYLDYINTAQ